MSIYTHPFLNAYRFYSDPKTVPLLLRRLQSRISESNFRATGSERPDAVMYCLGAMERFDGMPLEEVKKISMEIAVLGMSGLDVNDPTEKYSVTSLEGVFSGLHLFCIEYVGFKMFEPSLDLGFDISSEYQQAKGLFDSSP